MSLQVDAHAHICFHAWSDDAILTWKCYLCMLSSMCVCMHVRSWGLHSSQGKSKPFVSWRDHQKKLKASSYLHTLTCMHTPSACIHTFKSALWVAFTHLYSLLLIGRHTGMSFNQLFSFNCVPTKAVYRIWRSLVCKCVC